MNTEVKTLLKNGHGDRETGRGHGLVTSFIIVVIRAVVHGVVLGPKFTSAMRRG